MEVSLLVSFQKSEPVKFKFLLIVVAFLFSIQNTNAQDWANLGKYNEANSKLNMKSGNRIVFMGNSITEGWMQDTTSFFYTKNYINRGIGGQTTPQMLVRFRADVIDIKADVVVILAGINDIAGNTGPSTIEMVFNNIKSMTELAMANNIKVVLSSVLPASKLSWKPDIDPAEKIVKLNGLINAYANKKGIVYLDYYTSMVGEDRGLRKELTTDGVHVTLAGYKIMEPLAERAIARALK